MALLSTASACAMSAPDRKLPRCLVTGAEKLAADSGGSTAICAAIEDAMKQGAAGADYRVEVRVLSRSRLSAIVALRDGRKLPEQHYATMDRDLSKAAIAKFAAGLAAETAKVSGR